ncbi:MAG: trigger factor [Deltaproteobacteria bacterium]|nr:trigger factor [Deltaproteobacteria bacterium]
MQTELVNLSAVRREVKVKFSEDEVSKTFKKKTRQVNEQVSVQGFRPGKAPDSVIQGRYGSEIKNEVLQELMESGLKTAMVEHKVLPVGPVEPPAPAETQKLENGRAFDFSLRFEVRPEIKIDGYKGLKLVKPKVEVSDAEVDKEIERFRMTAAQLVPVMIRDFVEEKDYVTLDIEANTLAGPVPELTVKEELVEIGPDRVLPGFTEKLIGQKVGDLRSFDLVYPKEGPAAELHEKNINFRVVVKSIKKLELPAVDDELAKDAGYESVDAMKAALKNSLTVVQNMRVRNKLRDQVLDELIKKHDFEVPESLVREQSMNILREALRRLQSEGMRYDLDTADVEQLIGTYRPKAERIVRGGLLLAEVAKAETLDVSEEDVDKQIESFAEMSKQDVTRVRAAYADPQRKEALRLQLIDEKVLDMLIAAADVSDGEPLPVEERQLR